MRHFFLSVAGYFSKLRYVLLLASMPFFSAAQSPSSIFVHFEFNKAILSQLARASLDSLTDSLDVADRIELHGHCDAIGSNSYNDRLSVKRVNAVQSYLLSIGWEKKDILIASGHGENNPVVENSTAENRSMNRRVEIKIIYGQAVNTIPVDNGQSLSKKIADTAVKAGTKIILRNINFAGGLHRFLPESYPMLEELLKVMQTYPSLVVQVEGHICCNPGPSDGLDNETGKFNLSEARAKAVKDYLIENGIKADRISYKGFGHSAPLFPYPESSLEQEKLNRRVEIRIISK
jgi:outer membrane protein OmpA-like peptidoglycan-associated protein